MEPRIDCYVNPLDVSIADPQILKDCDTYYLYGTTAAHRGFEVSSSTDLVHWRRHGFCLKKTEGGWGQDHFWAPEAVRNGDTYYLFYTTYNAQAGVRNICVAVSDSPLGPFTEAVTPILPVERGFIDSHPFRDPETGDWYLYAMEENLRPPVIWVARLSDDLLSLNSELTQCLTADQEWEHDWVEGPFVIRHNDTYYMTYSGFGYSSPDYAVGVATAPSPLGPWTKYEHNPILRRTGAVSGPGHNSIVSSPDGSELFVAYHCHLTFNGGGQRALAIDRIQFLENGTEPPLMAIDGPTHVRRPFPSGAPSHLRAASDEFDTRSLDSSHWMILGEDDRHWRFRDGALEIDTQNGDLWTDRIDARNIFLQYAPEGDFALECRLDFAPEANYEQAFLVIFQDQSNFLRLGTVYADRPRLEAACEVNGRYESVTTANSLGTTLDLRIVRKGTRYQFYVRNAAEDAENLHESCWVPVGEGYTVDWPQVKVGLGAASPASGANRVARFQYFRLTGR